MTKNFMMAEFGCKDGTDVPHEFRDNVRKLAQNLQVLRDHLGIAIYINSAYRTPAYNKRIGGASNSYHMKAMAADIHVKTYTPKQLAAEIEKLIKAGKMQNGGIGVYKTFVHYDIGPVRRWKG